jgi:hypothetical protein
MLNQDELRKSYNANGFVFIRGVYSSAEVDELNAQVEGDIREVVPTFPKDAACYAATRRP